MITHVQITSHGGSPSPVLYSLLRYQRLLRGWTQQDVANELYKLCAADGRPEAGICADTVSRWETANRKPSLFYQKYLCQLYGLTADRLGLLDGREGSHER